VTSKKRNNHLACFEKIAIAVAFLLAMFPAFSYADEISAEMNRFAKVVRANPDETPAEAASQPGNQNPSEIQKAKQSQEQEDERPVLKPMSELYPMDPYSTKMLLLADREPQEPADADGQREKNNKKNNFEKLLNALLNAVDEEQTEERDALVGNMDSEMDGADDEMGGPEFEDLSRIEADHMAEFQAPTHVTLDMAGNSFMVDYASREDDLMAAALNDLAKEVADEQENRKIENKQELTQEEQEPMSVLRESGLSREEKKEVSVESVEIEEDRPDLKAFSIFSRPATVNLGFEIAERIGKMVFNEPIQAIDQSARMTEVVGATTLALPLKAELVSVQAKPVEGTMEDVGEFFEITNHAQEPADQAKEMGLLASVENLESSSEPQASLAAVNPEMVEMMTTKLPVSNPEEMAGAMGLLTPALLQNEKENIGELIKPETAAPGESDKSEATKAFPALAFKMAMSRPVKNQLTSPPPAEGVFQSFARALEPVFATVTSVAPNFMSAANSDSPRSSYSFASTSSSDNDFFENNKFKFASYTLPSVSYSRIRGVYHSNASYDRSRKKRRFQSSF